MSVKTVDKSLQLLQHIALSEQPCGVADLSRELKLPKSNVFRLLGALTSHGFVKQREDTRYEPTLKLWELGALIVSRTSLTQVARPVLDDLARASGESTHLAVLDGLESIYIDKRDGPHPISGFTRIGTRAPAHCCATGKVELALRGPEAVAGLPPALKAYTASTIPTRAELLASLAAVRESGYAVNRGEWFDGVWGVAAAIRNNAGGVCASIGLWGPRERLSATLDDAVREVRRAADTVSRGLGCPAALLSNPNERSPA